MAWELAVWVEEKAAVEEGDNASLGSLGSLLFLLFELY